MEQYDYVSATFDPKNLNTLKQSGKALIGQTLEYQAGWIIEDGPYKGDWAMSFSNQEVRRLLLSCQEIDFCWVPLCDLKDVKPLPPPWEREIKTVGSS